MPFISPKASLAMVTKLFLSKVPKGTGYSGISGTRSVLTQAVSTPLVLVVLLSVMKSGQQKHEYYRVRSHFFKIPEGVDNLERRGTKELKRRLSVQKTEPQSDSINQAIDFLTSFDTDWLTQTHESLEVL